MSASTDLAEKEEASENFLGHLPAILWDRRWFIIIPAIICAVAGIAAAIFLPTTYRSSAMLLVESPELPPELVGVKRDNNTNVIDQRIAKIRQQILSRPDLIELIQNNNLYPDERRSKPLSEIVETIRGATAISPVNADVQQGRATTIAFSLSFDYRNPVQAQLVAQDFVERLLKLDSSQSAQAAESTVAFLQDQAGSLQEQLRGVEQQIEGIKARNGLALSSAGMAGIVVNSGGSYEAQIAALQRENAELMAKNQAARTVDNDPIVAAAMQALTTARSIYSDNHPDVRLAQQRLTEARQSAASRIATAGAASPAAAQIAANNSTIAQLQAARAADQSRSNAAISAQATAPLVMEQVAQLQARADGLRSNYERVSANLMAAQASAKMESEQRGERLSVIDPPVVPDSPTSPNRPLLVAGGIIGGIGLGMAIALLIELLLRPIRGVGALQNLLGVPPLVVVPTFRNSEPRWQKFMFWRRKKVARAKASAT